jgi:hypothetical protein
MATEIQVPRVPPKAKMTFEEFHDWCDEDTWAEWVDGEVIMVSPADSRRQEISKFLIKVLDIYVEARGLGTLFQAPFLMRLAERPSGREPDLIFIARERLHLLKKTYLDGPADLAIEVVSPESIGRDRGEKFVEYERAGIKSTGSSIPIVSRPSSTSSRPMVATAWDRSKAGSITPRLFRASGCAWSGCGRRHRRKPSRFFASSRLSDGRTSLR